MSANKNRFTPEELQEVAQRLRDASPTEIIAWGVEQIGAANLTFACSFGYEDVALVDIVRSISPEINIFYLDTDLHFKETYETRDRLQERYQVRFTRVATSLSLEQQAKQYAPDLWKSDPNQCCRLRKVEPLRRHLKGYQGWITGIRREQAPTRAHTEVVEWDPAFGLLKLNPFAFWNTSQVWNYIYDKKIPYNPLHDQNYPSIGCEPCTRQVRPGEDPRAGRWAHSEKIECGLHNTPLK